MDVTTIGKVISVLQDSLKNQRIPIVSDLSERDRDPFKILVATILSLRTKDPVTAAASERLFRIATTPRGMMELSREDIAEAIYPVGFYRNKAKTLLDISRELVENHSSIVPDTMEGLLNLKGVGRKTANLVLTLGYGTEGICVDTHVHRISNRFGFVSTKSPDDTEFALRRKLPKVYWAEYNTLLVAFGQRTCRPVSPLCSSCPVSAFCEKVNVLSSR